MKRVLTSEQMREVEAVAGARFGMPAAILMEHAGEILARRALELTSPTGRFLVVCGLGNNGGDGLVAARKLRRWGRTVQVHLCGPAERLEGEPKRNHEAMLAGVASAPGESWEPQAGDAVIDAIFGTGLNRAPTAEFEEAIRKIQAARARGAKVVSADLVSGLSADTGQAFSPCVEADATVAFSHLKLGHVLEPGASLGGRLHLEDIGIPEAAAAQVSGPGVFLLEEADVQARLPVRRSGSHKGTYGHVLLIAGSWGKTGAAALAGLGALRGGAGLVTVATRPEALVPVMAHAPELMGAELIADGPLGLSDLNTLLELVEGKQALVIGPGIPRGPETAKLLGELLEEAAIPCVLDADALNALAENVELLGRAKAPLVLTPHPGEMARLLGKSTEDVQADRLACVRELAKKHHVTVILKGARTLV
jgi:ADP-dependent NAD(P)H-hydrate dehydratase / NAD(P)H-hydrate epimerase